RGISVQSAGERDPGPGDSFALVAVPLKEVRLGHRGHVADVPGARRVTERSLSGHEALDERPPLDVPSDLDERVTYGSLDGAEWTLRDPGSNRVQGFVPGRLRGEPD